MRNPIISSLSIMALAMIAGITGCNDTDIEINTAETMEKSAVTDSENQWISYGNDYSEQRYSPLEQITTDNINELSLAWYGDLAERGGSYETTPLVADGRIFVSSPWSKVYAFDAKTGEQLWKYDPKVPGEWAVNLCCGIVNRGVAIWEDKVIWGTLDGRLVAVDAESGEKIWEVQATDRTKTLSITGAPRIADGRIFIGEAGSEFHQRGYLAAYDANNGDELWRWWSVPGNPALGFEQPELEWAAETWNGEWWLTGGGGTPWDAINYDPVTDLVIFGTGNGAPWPAEIRSPGGGDNLFTASIVAVDAKTGEYRWHYQATPEDSFDYDNTQQLVTADLVINGESKHVVMQAPKNGVFYVLEAATGEVLSADLFVPTANWLTGFDENFRPILNPEANYAITDRGFHVVPSMGGAHSWHPMAFSPDTGLMYIPTSYSSFPLVAEAGAKMGNQLLSINVAKSPEDPAPVLEGGGSYLLAWDPIKREAIWEQRQGSGRAGVMTTAGNLVFQASAQSFMAFRADTGEQVWSVDTQSGIVGGSASYEIDNEQYVAVVAGQSGGFGPNSYWAPNYARLLVYKLGGDAVLTEPLAYTPPELNPPESFGDAALIAQGEKQYNTHCASCHGNSDRVSSLFPDLRYAAALNTPALFNAIVIDGILQNNGMVSFKEHLNTEDTNAIRAYVISLSHDLKNNPPPAFGGPPPAAEEAESEDGGLHQ